MLVSSLVVWLVRVTLATLAAQPMLVNCFRVKMLIVAMLWA